VAFFKKSRFPLPFFGYFTGRLNREMAVG